LIRRVLTINGAPGLLRKFISSRFRCGTCAALSAIIGEDAVEGDQKVIRRRERHEGMSKGQAEWPPLLGIGSCRSRACCRGRGRNSPKWASPRPWEYTRQGKAPRRWMENNIWFHNFLALAHHHHSRCSCWRCWINRHGQVQRQGRKTPFPSVTTQPTH